MEKLRDRVKRLREEINEARGDRVGSDITVTSVDEQLQKIEERLENRDNIFEEGFFYERVNQRLDRIEDEINRRRR